MEFYKWGLAFTLDVLSPIFDILHAVIKQNNSKVLSLVFVYLFLQHNKNLPRHVIRVCAQVHGEY